MTISMRKIVQAHPGTRLKPHPSHFKFDKACLLHYAEKKKRQLMKRSDVLRILQEERQELVDRYNISTLSVFGSVARDDAREHSDVDILIEFSHPVGLFQFKELQQRLETLLGMKVDLGTPRSIKPRIKEQVLKEAVRITWPFDEVRLVSALVAGQKLGSGLDSCGFSAILII